MLVNREAELMYPSLEGLGTLACAGCFDTCSCAPTSSISKDIGKLKNGLGNAPNDYACSLDSICSAMMNSWCYSAGALTSRCIAWRQGLYGPPMPTPPTVPFIDPGGMTEATVDDIVAATAKRQAQNVADVFGQQADSMNPPAPETDYSSLLIVGGVIVGIIIVKDLIR